ERVEAHETDPSVLTDLDIAFHRAIGSATKNELIRKVYDITLDLFAPSIRQTHERADKGRNALEHHLRILEGIEARDRQRAEAAAAASIEQWVMLSS
ncbi:MAG TPA: FCD domain-containing protein, partial [Spirochaetia bacterium]